MKTTTGTSLNSASALSCSEDLEARHVRQAEIEHRAIARAFAQDAESFRSHVGRDDFDVVASQQLDDAHALGRVIFHNEQSLATRAVYSLILESAASTPAVVVGLVTKEKAPRAQPCWRSSSECNDLHGDVSRQRILLKLA